MLIKVKEGLAIRDPVTKMFIPPEGLDVPDGDPFWQRRLRDGDVSQADAQAASPQVKFKARPRSSSEE